MPGPYSLSDLPAPVAVRWVALALLRDASRAFRRFKSEPSGTAATAMAAELTRLRHWTEAFAPHFGDSLRPRHRRRFERLETLGSRCRALEHRLARLPGLSASNRTPEPGHALVERLAEQLHAAEADFRDAVLARFPRLRSTWRRRLGRYAVSVAANGLPSLPPFRAALADCADPLLDAIQEALPAGSADIAATAAESARHAATRLRSVLAAAAAEVTELADGAGRLAPLTDLLEGLQAGNDLAAELVYEAVSADMPDVDVAATLLRALYERQQLDVAAARLRGPEAVAALRAALRGEFGDTRPGGPVNVEIERKFLLDGMPVLPSAGVEVLQVDQGWLPGVRLLERLRRVATPHGEEFFRTVKLGRGVRRIEVEEATQRELFEAMWPLTQGRRVRKTRYRVPADKLTWEIDLFAGRDLVLAEVEIPSAGTTIRFPAWLEPHVVREVTDDPAYVNVNLAR